MSRLLEALRSLESRDEPERIDPASGEGWSQPDPPAAEDIPQPAVEPPVESAVESAVESGVESAAKPPPKPTAPEAVAAPLPQREPAVENEKLRRPSPTEFERLLAAEMEHPRRGPQWRQLFSRRTAELGPQVAASTLLVGVEDDEHVTLAAGALAMLLSQEARDDQDRVLLIDADYRSRRITTRFDLDSEPGLTDVLLGRRRANEVVLPTAAQGLDVLPLGKARSVNVPDDSATFISLMAALQQTFSHVVIDGGSVTCPFSDALTRASEGSYLLVELDGTPCEAAEQAVERLRAAGGRLIGCIVTQPTGSR